MSGPKGTSLAKLRERFGGDEIELDVPPPSFPGNRLPGAMHEGVRKVKVSTADWSPVDPERTYVIISHHYRPTADEAAAETARRGDASPFPPEAEAMRQEWRAALEANEQQKAAELKARFDNELAAQHWVKPYAKPDEGNEVQPRVYLLDLRPKPVA